MNNKLKMASIIALLVLAIVNPSFSTTRRVNNNPGVTGTNVYVNLDLAEAAAAVGDTLIIEGSNATYGNKTFTKRLVIFGPGYHLNYNPQTQATFMMANLGDITFGTGSAESIIMGCKINSITVNANSIRIARNFTGNITISTRTNIVIERNIVWGTISNQTGTSPTVIIRNNLMGRVLFDASVGDNQIINNSFSYGFSHNNFLYVIDVNNSIIMNNIIYSYQGWGQLKFDVAQNNTIIYNILSQADPAIGLGESNQFSVNMALVFAGGGDNIDNKYVVQEGSVAYTGGQNGTECGMFGGDFPYVLSGLPPIPHIYKLEADPAGNNENPLNVKISVKSQN
jgi:hypothetical protein